MISPTYIMNPPMYWTSPDLIMIFPTCIIISTRCTEHPQCTYGIPPHASWYPPHPSWYSPDVLNIHHTGWRCRPYCIIVLLPDVLMIFPTCIIISTRCTEHPDELIVSSHMHHDIPHMHHDILPMYWTYIVQGGDVAHITLLFYFPMYSWYSPHASSYPLDLLNIPDVLMVSPHMHHDILPIYWTYILQGGDVAHIPLLFYFPMYSWYSPHASLYPFDVLNIPDVLTVSPNMHHDIPNMHHDILPMYWTYIVQGGDVAHIALLFYFPMYSWYSPHASSYQLNVLNIPDVLMLSPHIHHDILPMYWTYIVQGGDVAHLALLFYFPMYSWYSPHASSYPLDVLNIPDVLMVSPHMHHDIPNMHHDILPMYWTYIVQGGDVAHYPLLFYFLMYSWYSPHASSYPLDVLNNPDVLMVSPHMHHDIPTCIMIFSRCTEHTLYRVEMSPILRYCFTSRCTHDIPHMHHHIHSMYWTSPMYLWYSPTCIMISPTCIMIFSRCTEHTLYRVEMSPILRYCFTSRCTHDIPHMHHHIHSMYWTSPMSLWYPPTSIMISPTCIMIFSRCTEHTLYRVEMSPILRYCFTSRCTHDIPHMHHHIHSMYWTSRMYLWYPPHASWFLPM